MIHKINNFRIYAAIDYDCQQLYSMMETIPGFPYSEISELVELYHQPINGNWREMSGEGWVNKRSVIVSNAVKSNSFGIGVIA